MTKYAHSLPGKIKVLVVFGTRPEAIKLAPVVDELKRRSSQVDCVICATTQQRDLQDQALKVFGLVPDYDLNIMTSGQSLNDIVSRVLLRIGEVLQHEKPDYVILQGDTSTAFAASLAAFHVKALVGHVEAGLRTHQKYAPFPEEINRRLISVIADLHFAPTEKAKTNLIEEGINPDLIFVTGNTVIDALYRILNYVDSEVAPPVLDLPPKATTILVTGHRRESFGKGFHDICLGLKGIAEKYPDIHLVYPVHLNPQVQEPVFSQLGKIKNIHLIEPLDYLSFLNLLKKAKFVISDSGGIQEEATALGKSVLVMRGVTERPEAIEAGVCKLVGTDPDKILLEASVLLENEEADLTAVRARNIYGDGKAAQRIVSILLEHSEKA